MHALLKNDAEWQWTQACSEAVCVLKHWIASAPTLALFSPNAPTFVSCDASAVVIGSNISQIKEGEKHPINFASQALSPFEQKYSAGKHKVLSCTWAC